jgi:hypothetical protein
MPAELKPCPFCGGLPKIDLRGNVVCLNCPAWISAQYGDAVAIWNRRAGDKIPVLQDNNAPNLDPPQSPSDEIDTGGVGCGARGCGDID